MKTLALSMAVTLKGVVPKLEWMNPHSCIYSQQ
jgi:hypothetical protein